MATPRRILLSAFAALTLGLGVVSLIWGFSDSFPVRLLQGVAVFGAGVVIIGGTVVAAMIRLAGWREPESDFEAIVQRAERLAADGETGEFEVYGGEPDDEELFDPHDEEDFKALVRSALDELPLEFHRARARRGRRVRRRPAPARLRALPGRHRGAGLLSRPDRDLPRHARARLRA
jgi:hypothetical protein